MLPLLLKAHSCQRILSAEIRGLHTYEKAAVYILAVSGTKAHAICHKSSVFRGCRHHIATGAHAEGIDRASVRKIANKLVIRGRKPIRKAPELRTGYKLLAMLNANTYGKGLSLHRKPRSEKHIKGVTRRVSGCEHQCVAG